MSSEGTTATCFLRDGEGQPLVARKVGGEAETRGTKSEVEGSREEEVGMSGGKPMPKSRERCRREVVNDLTRLGDGRGGWRACCDPDEALWPLNQRIGVGYELE